MIPLIPKVSGYYTQALGSNIIKNDITTLIDDQSWRKEENKNIMDEIEEIKKQCFNIPYQFVNIIKYTKNFLKKKGINIDDKVIAEGYSAGSKFEIVL